MIFMCSSSTSTEQRKINPATKSYSNDTGSDDNDGDARGEVPD